MRAYVKRVQCTWNYLGGGRGAVPPRFLFATAPSDRPEPNSGLAKVSKADGGAGGGSRPAPVAAAPASTSNKDGGASSLSTEENMELQLQTAKKLRSVSP